jgi:hypothetical protein
LRFYLLRESFLRIEEEAQEVTGPFVPEEKRR